jgi:excisionase family DNA binding protein
VNAPLLTTREVATLLGVSPETVLRWTRRGELPGIQLPGGALRYQRSALDAWLVARTTTAGTADRELSDTRADRARSRERYSDAVAFEVSDTRPPEAATTEEEDHAC